MALSRWLFQTSSNQRRAKVRLSGMDYSLS
jgi:hypothetical protein